MISEGLKTELRTNITKSSQGIRDEDSDRSLSFILSDKYIESQASYYVSVMEHLGINPTNRKILEIGSGYCFFLAYAYNKLKWDVYGIEPGKAEFSGRFELALRYLEENGVDSARLLDTLDKELSSKTGYYDIIVSNDVLEHVRDPNATLRDVFRLLKPGGVMIFNVPNYRWFYEGHYNIFWLPFLSKGMAKMYVKLWGRDPEFIEHLNFLTPRIIKRIVHGIPGMKFCLPLEYKNAEFIADRAAAYIESAGKENVGFFVRMLAAIATLKMFRHFMRFFSKLTGCYHEMHIVVTKNID